MKRTWFAIAAVCAASACGGGGGDGGTTNPPPTKTLGSITVTPASLNLAAGNTATLTVQAFDESSAALSGATFGFSSSSAAVADVSSAGSVLALGAGTATITVTGTFNGVSKTQTVSVTVSGSLPLAVSVAGGTTQFTFSPALVAIARTGTVTWAWGSVAHNVTFDGVTGAPSNIPTGEGVNAARTFNTAGNFTYQCSLHAGMNGTVVVR